MYVSKCPKCGSHNIESYGQWDIVTDQVCEDCGWERNYGSVVGPAGSHYLQPNCGGMDFDFDDFDPTYDEDEEETGDPSEVIYDYSIVETDEKQGVPVPIINLDFLDYEESDDLPF